MLNFQSSLRDNGLGIELQMLMSIQQDTQFSTKNFIFQLKINCQLNLPQTDKAEEI